MTVRADDLSVARIPALKSDEARQADEAQPTPITIISLLVIRSNALL